ncbi:hypothetical protein ACFVXC_07140 [Streptomyces sp. NPDC058257]|uniref:hypothetical protein n=1 Tax=Streptomyces sp. NPDC058257 TaxID=3346409 RepID=UPI0036DFEBD9
MAHTESGKKVMGWATAAALLAMTPLMAACSGGTSDDSGASSDKSSSAQAGDNSEAQAGGRSTVPSVVSAWVGAVIEKDAKQSCLLSAVPGSGGSAPKAATAQTCDAAMLKKMDPGLKSMSKAFAPQNASGKPTVKVDAPTPDGDKATVPTAKINVGGKPLRDIMLSRSHGVDAKSFTAKVQTAKVDGKWYVGDFDINVGNSGSGSGSGNKTLQPQQP